MLKLSNTGKLILENILWLGFDKLFKTGLSIYVTTSIAMHLKPSAFGELNFAIALTSFFSAFALLGLKDIVVRDLVRRPEKSQEILQASLYLVFSASIASYISLIVLSLLFLGYSDTFEIIAIIGLSLIFQSSIVLTYWFEAIVKSKAVVWLSNIIFLVVASTKIWLVAVDALLIVFAWMIALEGFLLGLGYFFLLQSTNGRLRLDTPNWRAAKVLLTQSWPLLLSNLSILVYMRIDQIMLMQMLGSEDVGIYTAALRLSEIWYIVPMYVTMSLFPSLVNFNEHSQTKLKNGLQILMNLLATMSLMIAVAITFLSEFAVSTLYGSEYESADIVLAAHIWATPLVFLGVPGSRWYVLNGLQKEYFYFTLIGAVLNLGLNFYFIPAYGAIGAAITTIISYAMSAYFLDLCLESTRTLFRMKSKAIFVGPVESVRLLYQIAQNGRLALKNGF